VALTRLVRLDNAPVEDENLSDDFKTWLANQVDIINSNYEELDNLLASIDARLTAGGL
jgi:hypothetical protein